MKLAALLRQLLDDGTRSLVQLVNDPDDADSIKLVFTVRGDEYGPNIGGWHPIAPTGDGRPVVDLGLEAFLNWTVVNHWHGNDQEDSQELSVRNLIKYIAEVAGAIHHGEPKKRWQKALAEYGEMARYQTATGQYSGPVFCLIEVAGVARKALEPLRKKVAGKASAVERMTGRARKIPSEPEAVDTTS
jgi:hypothetical protein